jgi:hypothetical protein
MRTYLLAAAAGVAALCIPSVSTAQPNGGVTTSANHRSHDSFDGFVRDQPRLRGRSPDGAWGYYYGDYDANRGFDPEKWNDWWHDRPDRSFPRWVQSNQNCSADRMWWSGSGWHC